MLFAINVPQTKSISIAFVALKSNIFGLIITATAQTVSNSSVDQQCMKWMTSFVSVLEICFILGVIIDVCALGYFYFSNEFKKIEYYIFYVFHIIITIVCLIGALSITVDNSGCELAKSFSASVISLVIILQINILVTMISNLFIVLKFLHFGSNLLWFVLWTTTIDCPSRIDLALIALIHTLLSLSNAVTLILYRWIGKTLTIVKMWQTLCLSSFFLMILCYLIALLGLGSTTSCQEADFSTKLYIRYGILEIISPLLIMIFLRNEAGDPRQGKIKRHNEVFTKPEHQYVDFGAKI